MLYLITRDEAAGGWKLPFTNRNQKSSTQNAKNLHDSALTRLNGLLSEKERSAERPLPSNEALVFDIDGVLTSPPEERVPEEILDHLEALLNKGDKLSFNTGRPLSWAIENLLVPLAEKVNNPALLDDIVVMAEKGAVGLKVTEGIANYEVNETLNVPVGVKKAIEAYATNNKYLKHFSKSERKKFKNSLQYDHEKLAMASIYIPSTINSGIAADMEEHLAGEIGQKILADIQEICADFDLKLDLTTIAIDVENPKCGKNRGAEEIEKLQDLRNSGIKFIYTFGDSPSDIAMPEYFLKRGYETLHIHVGKKDLIQELETSPNPDLTDVALLDTSKYHQKYANVTAEQLRIFRARTCPELALPGSDVIESNVVDILPVEDGIVEATFVTYGIPSAMSTAEAEQYAKDLRGDFKFLKSRNLLETTEELPENLSPDETHRWCVEHGVGKFALRNIKLEDGKVVCEFTVVPFPAYKAFNSSEHPALQTFGSNMGVAATMVTNDGKLIVQHRKKYSEGTDGPTGNRVYGDIPGASAAGLADAVLSLLKQGKINIADAGKEKLLREVVEEVNISDRIKCQLTAIMLDKVAKHHELAFTIKANYTALEIEDMAKSNQQIDDGVSFKENIILIDATPDAIEKLLCEVKSPLPMTHAGPYLMLGYELFKAEYGESKALAWMERVKAGMDENYKKIDAMCKSGRYDPNINATDQGLPDLIDELKRVFGNNFKYIDCGN